MCKFVVWIETPDGGALLNDEIFSGTVISAFKTRNLTYSCDIRIDQKICDMQIFLGNEQKEIITRIDYSVPESIDAITDQ